MSSDQDHGSPYQSMTCKSAASSAIHRIKMVAASRIPSASSFWGAIMLHFMVVYMYSYTIIDSVYKMPGR